MTIISALKMNYHLVGTQRIMTHEFPWLLICHGHFIYKILYKLIAEFTYNLLLDK